MQQSKLAVAILDDDDVIRELMTKTLNRAGYATRCYTAARDLLEAIGGDQPDLIILDLHLRGAASGADVIERLRSTDTATPIIICSADVDALYQLERRLRGGGCAILEKPFRLRALIETVEKMIGLP